MPRLPAFHKVLEIARAPSLAQLAQRLRLDLANTFARDGEHTSWSSTTSPSELCSSSPSGVSSEIGSLTSLSTFWSVTTIAA